MWFKITKKDPGGTVKETIFELIEQDDQGPQKALDADERILLGNILDLKETFVYEIMVPRAQLVAIDKKLSVEDAVSMMIKNQMHRIIVYEDNLDKILGYVNLVDCLPSGKEKPSLEKAIQEIDAISPRMSILDLLLKMKHTGEKQVLVLDDHGGIEGIVTFSDLIQEIIGNIESDNHLNPPGKFMMRDNGDIVTDGHVELEVLEEEYDLKFIVPEDIEVNTIAGYITSHIGRLPSRGELISHPDGRDYLIVDASPRKIKRICIRDKAKMANT